jgi:hypothetical protein
MMKRLDVSVLIAAAFLSLAANTAQARPASPDISPVPANLAPHPAPEQPLPYSHKTHVGLGLACRLCHVNPAPGKEMSFPATSTCMTCHASVVTGRPAIQKLTRYAHAKQAIPWVRVYQVLPGVTWTHRKHLQAGVQCETCHGAVEDLQAMSETTAVTAMASCISCHQARGASTACAVCHSWPAT